MNTSISRFNKGFTLTEVMVVIIIASILTTIGVKSYRTIIANSMAVELATALNSSLKLAKNEAIHRSTNITICALNGPGSLTCDDTATIWQYGWMVIVQATAEVIQTYQINQTVPVVPTVASTITYGPSGIADQDFTFTIQPSNCDRGYLVSSAIQQDSGGALQTQTIGCP